jgi:predicted AAA+ superfamily ATPase
MVMRFEQFLVLEVRAYLSYRKNRKAMTFWKTYEDFEVDIVIGDEVGIEIKSSKKVSNRDLKSIRKLDEEKKIKTFYLISQDEIDRKIENVHCLHWKTFLKKLWNDQIL